MKYAGGKAQLFKSIYSIIEPHIIEDFVEPFLGGANFIDKVDPQYNRIAGEHNQYIASMWIELLKGWYPETITKEQYKHIRDNKNLYPDHFVGWVGVACSYSGKWFAGFAGKTNTQKGIRDYQDEAFKNLDKQLKNLKGVKVSHCSYENLVIKEGSVIYCDPPYEGTLKYKDDFDHPAFYEWVRLKVSQGFKVFISEYAMPEDFICIWSKQKKSSLSANGKTGGSKVSIEKLFIHESQLKSLTRSQQRRLRMEGTL